MTPPVRLGMLATRPEGLRKGPSGAPPELTVSLSIRPWGVLMREPACRTEFCPCYPQLPPTAPLLDPPALVRWLW